MKKFTNTFGDLSIRENRLKITSNASMGLELGLTHAIQKRKLPSLEHREPSFNRLWTEEEIFILKEFYPRSRKIKMILPLLPSRTLGSIHKKAQMLGLKWVPRKRPDRQELERLYNALGTKQAAETLGTSPTTFRRWMGGAGAKLKNPIKNPDLTPSAKLMYVLGVLKGDGYVYKRGRAKVVELETVKEEFTRSFATVLKEIGLFPSLRVRRLIKGSREYTTYTASAISKNFVEWYKNTGLVQIREMIGENKEFATAFVRGFYESEGSYGISKGYPSISICNTDLSLLLFVKDLISSLGYNLNLNKASKTSTGKPFYRLRKYGKVVPELIREIKPCIKAEPSNLHAKEGVGVI